MFCTRHSIDRALFVAYGAIRTFLNLTSLSLNKKEMMPFPFNKLVWKCTFSFQRRLFIGTTRIQRLFKHHSYSSSTISATDISWLCPPLSQHSLAWSDRLAPCTCYIYCPTHPDLLPVFLRIVCLVLIRVLETKAVQDQTNHGPCRCLVNIAHLLDLDVQTVQWLELEHQQPDRINDLEPSISMVLVESILLQSKSHIPGYLISWDQCLGNRIACIAKEVLSFLKHFLPVDTRTRHVVRLRITDGSSAPLW